jgi:hypothetical protein
MASACDVNPRAVAGMAKRESRQRSLIARAALLATLLACSANYQNGSDAGISDARVDVADGSSTSGSGSGGGSDAGSSGSSSGGTATCALDNPNACGGCTTNSCEGCALTPSDTGTECIAMASPPSGGQGATCTTSSDCSPGYGCITDSPQSPPPYCLKWCMDPSVCPSSAPYCAGPIIVNGQQFGSCVP